MKMSSFCGAGDITKIYVVEPAINGTVSNLTADTVTIWGDLTVDGDFYNCGTGSTVVNTIEACDDVITIASDIVPPSDGLISIGRPIRRFREVNAVSGMTTIWAASTRVVTPEVTLGYDSQGELRILTANSSVLQNDSLNGGIY
jgi:hypothetical protein